MSNDSLSLFQRFVSPFRSIAKRIEFPSWSSIFVIWLSCAALTLASTAQTFTSLLSFDGTNGATPEYGALVQGFDGRFYGTTSIGGSNGGGTVFKVTPQGALTTLYNFCAVTNCADGKAPYGGVALGIDGNFYGTTSLGGVNGYGTVFKITPGGAFTTLHSFEMTDGMTPTSQLIQGTDGEFYGTTKDGGKGFSSGTIFKITPNGALSTLLNFDENHTKGTYPIGGLTQGSDGNFYGTTYDGGEGCARGCGVFYQVTSGGGFTTLALLGGDVKLPYDAPIQATNGNFYATSSRGGGSGDVFEVDPSGTIINLLSFNRSNGMTPIGGLVQATDGNLYGTTSGSAGCIGLGAFSCGSLFEITLDGTLTTLHNFEDTDGKAPLSALLQATDGNFYGTASTGGTAGDGTLFKLAVELEPFVKAVPGSDPVGKAVTILGNNLASATAVSFNGTSASFTASASRINTTVPAGATTGTIIVTLPTATLSSNVAFYVTP